MVGEGGRGGEEGRGGVREMTNEIDIEYHSASSVVVTVQVQNAPPGEVAVLASNDGGKRFGPSCVFNFSGKRGRERVGMTRGEREDEG